MLTVDLSPSGQCLQSHWQTAEGAEGSPPFGRLISTKRSFAGLQVHILHSDQVNS